MDPADALILTLVALHVVEGLFWVHRHALVIARTPSGARRVGTDGPLGNADHVFVLLDPWPPLRERFVVEPWPISFTEAGVVPVRPELPIGTRERPAEVEPIAWAALTEVGTSGKEVVTRDRRIAVTSSVAFAQQLAEDLRTIASADDKPAAIEATLARAFDVDAARARHAAFKKQTGFLNVVVNLVPVVMIGGVAGIFYVAPLFSFWPTLLTIGVGLVLLAGVDMFRAHRELYPSLGAKRVQDLLLMLVSLPAVARARGWIARDVLAEYHPITAAAVLLDDAAFAEVAAETSRGLAHPLAVPGAAAPIVEAMRARLRGYVERVCESRGLEAGALATTPRPSTDRVVGICPRCHAEFERPQDECPDCPGIALVATK
ncbi:MAG: hypothetical protein RMA76_29355 [Deltaproteobacteria bacterium]|jgi:hypothetical protein